MAPLAHSAFSASAGKRLLACPGSYALGVALAEAEAAAGKNPRQRSSIFAAEGTAAHSLSEACIFSGKDPHDFVGDTLAADGFTFTVDEDFASAVAVYVQTARALRVFGSAVGLEVRVSPVHMWSGLAPLDVDLFGTADTVAYNLHTRHLTIADLKFGKGISVEVEDNPQLLYYAAGAADPRVLRQLLERNGTDTSELTDGELTPDEITIIVVQPRALHRDGPVRRWNLRHKALVRWTRQDLYLGVKAALDDDGSTLAAGDHCRFCPALPTCSAPRESSLAAAKDAFAAAPATNTPAGAPTNAAAVPLPPALHLSDAELGELLDKIEVITPWLASVKDHALERMRDDKKTVPGWKVVPKRAIRAFAEEDDDKLRQDLKDAGLSETEFLTSKVLSPAQVQKKIGKSRYDCDVAPHVVKRSSGLTTAPEGDPRQRAMTRTSAQTAFGTTNPKPRAKGDTK